VSLFAIGAALFALGAAPLFDKAAGGTTDAIVYFIGSVFFTSAALLMYIEAVNAGRTRFRFFAWEPRDLAFWASLVQLFGTIYFNHSTFAAIKHKPEHGGRRPPGVEARSPGLHLLLIASFLAWRELGGAAKGCQAEDLSWWIVYLNILGSFAFGVSGGSVRSPDDRQRCEQGAREPGDVRGSSLLPRRGYTAPARADEGEPERRARSLDRAAIVVHSQRSADQDDPRAPDQRLYEPGLRGPAQAQRACRGTVTDTGWYFAHPCSHEGIVATGTKAEEANTSGAMIGNEAACAVSGSSIPARRARKPTRARTPRTLLAPERRRTAPTMCGT